MKQIILNKKQISKIDFRNIDVINTLDFHTKELDKEIEYFDLSDIFGEPVFKGENLK
jgi:hypothetical protein